MIIASDIKISSSWGPSLRGDRFHNLGVTKCKSEVWSTQSLTHAQAHNKVLHKVMENTPLKCVIASTFWGFIPFINYCCSPCVDSDSWQADWFEGGRGALVCFRLSPPAGAPLRSFPLSHLPRSEVQAAALGKQSCWLKQLLGKAEGKFVQYT